MQSEHIEGYEIEYAGVLLPSGDGWAAHVAIYGPSSNPMHRNCIFADQGVSVDTVFPNEESAEAEAHKVALSMLASVTHHGTDDTK
ncbi:hypothetical protein ACFQAT_09525 [Undibacterium arcticum]|uniref:Uncharacterized protein n=1 Tax=Undibacterium arcticum TaxID=1762892 RepID=A0ABV7F4N4_9BURK